MKASNIDGQENIQMILDYAKQNIIHITSVDMENEVAEVYTPPEQLWRNHKYTGRKTITIHLDMNR